MTHDRFDYLPIDDPHAQLERALIDEYLMLRGHQPQQVRGRTDPAAQELLTQASTYAATKLTEVEARAHYVQDLHGSAPRR